MSQRLRALLVVPVLLMLLSIPIFSTGGKLGPLRSFLVTATSEPNYGMVGGLGSFYAQGATPTPQTSPDPTQASAPTQMPTPVVEVQPTFTPAVEISFPVSQLHLQVFEELWQAVDNEYLYTDYNGLNWNTVYDEVHRQISSGLSDEQFYNLMRDVVVGLGDEHSVYLTPQEVAQQEAEYAGNRNFVGVGFLLVPIPAHQRAAVLLVFPGSPAEAAGLEAHDNILAVDGEPVLDENGGLRNLIRGPEGTEVILTVQKPGQDPFNLTLNRRQIRGSVPVPYRVMRTPEGQRVGYILLVTLHDSTVDDQFRQALLAMTAEEPLDGLVIDNRYNTGGADTVLRGILAYFTQGTLGHFVSRQDERALSIWGEDVQGSQALPLVVLVGPHTFSYGEIFAGILQDMQRAYLIGQPTKGNVETLHGFNLPDGSRAWLAHKSFRPKNNPEQDWEQSGILPDFVVESNWDEAYLESDPALLAAFDYFDRNGTLAE